MTTSADTAATEPKWRTELRRIADDYQPDGIQAILALEEMRQALRELLESTVCDCGVSCQDKGDGYCRYAAPAFSMDVELVKDRVHGGFNIRKWDARGDLSEGKFTLSTAPTTGSAPVAFYDPNDTSRQESFVWASDYPCGAGSSNAPLYAAPPANAPAASTPLMDWNHGIGLLWDVYDGHGKWFKRIVSPVGWDAHTVYLHMQAALYAPHIEIRLVSASTNSCPDMPDSALLAASVDGDKA